MGQLRRRQNLDAAHRLSIPFKKPALLRVSCLSLPQLRVIAGCIIRASDTQACSTHVVYRALPFVCGQRQREDMDGAAFCRRLLPPALGIFSEAHFPGSLKQSTICLLDVP
jgi:hypothetical protein